VAKIHRSWIVLGCWQEAIECQKICTLFFASQCAPSCSVRPGSGAPSWRRSESTLGEDSYGEIVSFHLAMEFGNGSRETSRFRLYWLARIFGK
jgi:hypothetical protein